MFPMPSTIVRLCPNMTTLKDRSIGPMRKRRVVDRIIALDCEHPTGSNIHVRLQLECQSEA